jgi:hypothetical protein
MHVSPGGSVIVPLIIEGLPETIEALGTSWQRKAEFHLTAASSEKLEAAAPGRADLWRVVTRVASNRSLGSITVRDEVRRVANHPDKPALRTLIVMVQAPGLQKLYADLSAALGGCLELPPAHVTLYSSDPFDGIGLDHARELAERAPPLSRAEQTEVMEAMNFWAVFGA